MNELIKVTVNDGRRAVYARDLYIGLGLNKSQWSRWFKTNILENEYFKENIDWVGVRHNVEGNETQDFVITLDFGKHIAMMAKTEKSHEYRNYFIEVERHAKQLDASSLSPELQLFNSIFQSVAKQELENKEIKKEQKAINAKVDNISEIVALNTIDWRKDATNLINKIVRVMGNVPEAHREIRNTIFEEVDRRAGTLLNTRLTNKRRRMADEGVAKSKRNKLSKVDVISDDKKLIEIYVAIVKEYAINYGVYKEVK